LDYGGVKVFARLLCQDPSCHLMAIILVNLTFAEADLRKEIVSPASGIELVESLSFALRVSSLTPEEYEARQAVLEADLSESPTMRLRNLMAEDQRLRPSTSDDSLVDPTRQLFPETARWCLSALKNLTRPAKESGAAQSLIQTGIVPLILHLITIFGPPKSSMKGSIDRSHSSSSESPTPIDPLESDQGEFTNAPSAWDSNSMQDAALFIVMNLSACPSSRDYVKEADAVSILAFIAEYRNLSLEERTLSEEEQRQQEFQCMKAVSFIIFSVCSSSINECRF
jgi:hypothetical protein